MRLRILGVCALLCAATSAFAATAYFTGNSRMGTSVTGRSVMNCEYQYAGQTFWRAFTGMCPMSVEVQ